MEFVDLSLTWYSFGLENRREAASASFAQDGPSVFVRVAVIKEVRGPCLLGLDVSPSDQIWVENWRFSACCSSRTIRPFTD